MASSKQDATFSLKVDDQVSGVAHKVADSLDDMREAVRRGQSEIGSLRKAMSGLKGSSHEVVEAKKQLKARIDALDATVTTHKLSIIKAGTSYEELSARSKKLKKSLDEQNKAAGDNRTKALGAAMSAAGGPVASLRDKVRSLSEIAGGPGAKGLGLLTFAVAGSIAVFVAATAAIAGGVVALAKWALGAANAERSMSLLREAAAGSADNARALGSQVDALADKVPTSKTALNDLAVSLAKGGLQGQQLVDTFNAVGQAAAAMGDTAANKIREIAERSRRSQRMFVNPFELQGTGLQIDDIARELSDGTAKGIAKARQSLVEGRVTLSAGAAAMRKAIETKFGDINLRKIGDISVLADKFREKLSGLASGINLEPLSRAASKLLALFDESTVTGATLKRIVTAFGDKVVSVLEAGIPKVKIFLQELIIGGLEAYIVFLRVRNALRDAFADDGALAKMGITKGVVDGLTTAFKASAIAIGAVVGIFAALVAWNIAVVAAFGSVINAVMRVQTALEDIGTAIGNWIKDTDFTALGTAIIDGICSGITSGYGRAKDAILGMADAIKGAFTGKKGIESNSPSKVFARYADYSVDGYADRIEERAPRAGDAAQKLASEATGGVDGAAFGRAGGGASSAGGAGAGIVVHASIVVHGSPEGATNAVASSKESLLAQITKVFEDAAAAASSRMVGA